MGCIQKSDPAMALLSMDVLRMPDKFRALSMHVLYVARIIMLIKWKNNIVLNITA